MPYVYFHSSRPQTVSVLTYSRRLLLACYGFRKGLVTLSLSGGDL